MPVRKSMKQSVKKQEEAMNQPQPLQEAVVSVVTDEARGEERVLYSWMAPVRPFKDRNRDYYTTIAAIAFLVIIILVFMKEFLLIAVVIAFAFVAYVLAAVPPEEIEHQLTSRGIRSAGKLYRWGELRRYWFSEKFGQKMIMIQTFMLFPGQLLLMLGKGNEKKVRDFLNDRLPYDQPEPTFLDKSANWLSEKVPLEGETKAVESQIKSKK